MFGELVPVEALGLVNDVSEVLPMGRGYLTWRGGSRRVAGPGSYRKEAVAKGVWVELHQHPQGAEPPEDKLDQIAGPRPSEVLVL